MEPEHNNDDPVLSELKELRKEVQSIKTKDNGYFIGVIQGLLLALVVWYILTPIAHWSVSSMITFFISTPLIEKIKYWISFPFFFIPPIAVCSALFSTKDKGTNRANSRAWTYAIVAAILIIYSMNEAWPIIKSMM